MINLHVCNNLGQSFWKSQKNAYYIAFDGRSLGSQEHLYIRRDGTVGNSMGNTGHSPLLYFYTKRSADKFCSIAIEGYNDGSCSATPTIGAQSWAVFPLRRGNNVKTSTRHETTIYVDRGTEEVHFFYSSSKKKNRDAYVKTYQKFYEIGKTGKIILDVDDLCPYYS